MKSFIIFLIYFSTNILFVNAQSNVPVAKQVSGGVWIYLGNRIPKGMQYQIERKKEGTGRYEKIGNTQAPVSLNELGSRQNIYSPFFSSLDNLNSTQINSLWNYIESHNTIDSMFTDNLPVSHLLAGTAFFDDKAEKNVNYKYKVSLLDKSGNTIFQSESNGTSDMKPSRLPAIKLSTVRYADGRLALTWAVKDALDMAHFNVYRSVFGEDNYKKIKIEKGVYTEKDSLRLLAIDTIGNSPAWYEYKITPVDAYGMEGAQQAAANGGNVQEYYAPPVTGFRAVNTKKSHQIKLSWHFANKKYLNGISVMRSRQFDSGYIRIATVEVNDTSFTDIVPVSGENFYYYLELISSDNKPLNTAKVFAAYTEEGTIPEPPSEVAATPDPNGIKVYWKYSEPYVKGFYVYRRGNNSTDFTQVSSFIPAGETLYSFSDTSGLVRSNEVYDYVVRVTGEDNQLSKNSDTVTTHSGRKIILTSPINLRYRNDNGIITIIWDDMRLWNNDLLGYKIFRRAAQGAFIELPNDSLSAGKNFFIDSSKNNSTAVTYGIICLDIFGNHSLTAEIAVPVTTPKTAVPPSGIQIIQTSDGVYITWGQIAGDIKAINIYKSESGKKPVMVKSINDDDHFTDKDVKKGVLYFYQLSAVGADNKEGQLSEKAAVRIR